MYINNISIFVAAHKQFDEYIYPMNDIYTIIYQNNLHFEHKSISLNEDEFTQRYAKLYSEGCALHYLYTHPELIKDYIVFYHYRRYFTDFINHEDKLIEYIDKYDCLVPEPTLLRCCNYGELSHNISYEPVKTFLNIIKINYPEYISDINKWKYDTIHYGYNIFGMKKENFLKMCDFCFNILSKLCEEFNLTEDKDILISPIKCNKFNKYRLIGYFLEHLTHLYYKHNFSNFYQCNLHIPNRIYK